MIGYISLKKRVSQLEREEQKSGYINRVVILLTFDQDYNGEKRERVLNDVT